PPSSLPPPSPHLRLLRLGPAERGTAGSVGDQTRLVLMTQAFFYVYGGLPRHLPQRRPAVDERAPLGTHFSILDHDRRALLGTLLALFAGPAVVSLEASRPAPYWSCRVLLAGCVGFGILLTCLIRESGWFAGHAFAGCLGFGSSFALIVICALNHADSGCAVLVTGLLSLVTVATGLLQGGKLAGLCHFPSWGLGLGEGLIVLCWGAAISQLAHA
ncbi:unnamed protein product, partial [Prorocentrum cordatum]